MNILLFLNEINIFAVTRYREINILTYLGLKSPFLSLRVSWDGHIVLSEINILAVTRYCEINIFTSLGLKSPFLSLRTVYSEHFACF